MLLALFLLAGLAPPPPEALRARFIGNMAFEIGDGTSAILTDFPYESGAFGYMTWTRPAPASPAALCLITHCHADHWLESLAPLHCARVAGPADVVAAAPGRVLDVTAGASWGAFRITPVPSVHGHMKHFSYLVEWNSRRLYLTGDTDDPATLLAQRDLDVAFVSPWLLAIAKKGGAAIPARRVIVYHHQTGERVAEHQGREVPSQGEELVLAE